MKILLLANDYLGLSKPILKEIQQQGHEVLYVADDALSTDCYYRKINRFVKIIRNIFNRLFHIYEKYWEKAIKNNTNINDFFDVLFCIQGVSFHPYLLNILRKHNPHIKTSLYIWDSNKYYDYFRNAIFFDQVFTFDIEDSKQGEFVNFLPFYWLPHNDTYRNIKYDISIIGSDHDGRIEIVEKVYNQINSNLRSYFKIIISKFPLRTNRLKLIFMLLFKYVCFVETLEKWKHKLTLPFVSFEYMPQEDVNKIIQESNCILDTDRECQSGTTPRVIWALAMGKKIISTNTHLVDMPFYNEKQIKIIDRNNPEIDIDFAKTEEIFDKSEYISDLRIDNWVKKFINF